MHVAILGNGVTGVSAALELRKRRPEWKITLVSGEQALERGHGIRSTG